MLGVGDTPLRTGSFLPWKVVMTATAEMGRKAGPVIKGQPVRSTSSDIPEAPTSAQTHVPRRPDASKAAPGSRSLQALRSYSLAPGPRAASPPYEPRSPPVRPRFPRRTFLGTTLAHPTLDSLFLDWLQLQLLPQFVKYAERLIGSSALPRRRVTPG